MVDWFRNTFGNDDPAPGGSDGGFMDNLGKFADAFKWVVLGLAAVVGFRTLGEILGKRGR